MQTARLRLQLWQEAHRDDFAAMNADPEVMADLGGPIDREQSDLKFERYRSAFDRDGVSRWALEDRDGRFVGYAGVMLRNYPNHPLGPHHDVGWRLVRSAWGRGYATEASNAAIRDAFDRLNLPEILSYTSEDNKRSRAVMARLGLRRDFARDFSMHYPDVGDWHGLVWVAAPAST